MLKNINVIDLLFVLGWICFGIDAILLVIAIASGRFSIIPVLYAIYLFILGCFIFMTRSLMEMAETQKKRNEIILDIAKKFENRV